MAVFDAARAFFLEIDDIANADLFSDLVGALKAREVEDECEGTAGASARTEDESDTAAP